MERNLSNNVNFPQNNVENILFQLFFLPVNSCLSQIPTRTKLILRQLSQFFITMLFATSNTVMCQDKKHLGHFSVKVNRLSSEKLVHGHLPVTISQFAILLMKPFAGAQQTFWRRRRNRKQSLKMGNTVNFRTMVFEKHKSIHRNKEKLSPEQTVKAFLQSLCSASFMQ